MSGSGLNALPKHWEWMGEPPGGPELVERLSRRSEGDREVYPQFWE